MRIAILTIYSPDIWDYTQYTAARTLSYCAKHGYDYLLVNNTVKFRYPSWGKIHHYLEMTEPTSEYDYIFILDADCLILRDEIKLESFIEGNEAYKMLICDDKPNGGPNVNCGAMILKTHYLTTVLMNRIWKFGNIMGKTWDNYHEQECLNTILKDTHWSKEVKVFDANAFNSWFIRPDRPVPKDNFIAHFMAYSKEEKIKMIKSFLR